MRPDDGPGYSSSARPGDPVPPPGPPARVAPGAQPAWSDAPRSDPRSGPAGAVTDPPGRYPTPAPGAGYPTTGAGYRPAVPGSQVAGPGPAPGYGQGAPGYGYGQGAPGYGQGTPGYGQGAPAYGQGTPGYGQGAPAGPPRRRGRGAMIVAFVVVAVLVFSVVAVVSVVGYFAHSINEIASGVPTPTFSLLNESAMYKMKDRPGYPAVKARADAMMKKYVEATEDQILQWVPLTTEGLKYYQDFTYILGDHVGSIGFDSLAESMNPKELDLRVDADDADLTELERKFLAHEPFNIAIKVVRADGTEYTSDGTEAPPSPEQAATDRKQAEEFARTYVAAPDANGSYVAAAQAAIDKFGLQLTWADDGASAKCHSIQNFPLNEVVATYCMADPGLVYINKSFGGYPNNMNKASFVDTVKHEAAHSIIGQVCNTTAPAIAGANYEGVTSSYAVLYLGADRATLAASAEVSAHYAMTAATDATATAIHGGRC